LRCCGNRLPVPFTTRTFCAGGPGLLCCCATARAYASVTTAHRLAVIIQFDL
jgi:hypothetical protein